MLWEEPTKEDCSAFTFEGVCFKCLDRLYLKVTVKNQHEATIELLPCPNHPDQSYILIPQNSDIILYGSEGIRQMGKLTSKHYDARGELRDDTVNREQNTCDQETRHTAGTPQRG